VKHHTQPTTTDLTRWGQGTTQPPVLVPHPSGHDAAVAGLVASGWQITASLPAGTHLAKPLNHVLHFLIGLFTFGAWWLVWLVLAMVPRRHFVPRIPVGPVAS
jgi:hypothetical protein